MLIHFLWEALVGLQKKEKLLYYDKVETDSGLEIKSRTTFWILQEN